eukprot:12888.XXX_61929_62123_1 [CDS] Oithona nana genome sequencing.
MKSYPPKTVATSFSKVIPCDLLGFHKSPNSVQVLSLKIQVSFSSFCSRVLPPVSKIPAELERQA